MECDGVLRTSALVFVAFSITFFFFKAPEKAKVRETSLQRKTKFHPFFGFLQIIHSSPLPLFFFSLSASLLFRMGFQMQPFKYMHINNNNNKSNNIYIYVCISLFSLLNKVQPIKSDINNLINTARGKTNNRK